MMLVYGTPGIPLFSRAMTMTPHDTRARNDQQGQFNSKIKTNLFCRGGGATFLQIIVTGSQTITQLRPAQKEYLRGLQSVIQLGYSNF